MIYYVEDDQNILELAIYTLNQSGFKSVGFSNADDFFEACKKEIPDVVLLDIMLPGTNGLEILRMLRKSDKTKNIPVMLVSAKGSEIDKVYGLEAGADDYLSKPFGMMELVARVKALLRRAEAPSTLTSKKLICGDIKIDVDAHECQIGDIEVKLTLKEFDLLKILIENTGHALSRKQLFEDVWQMPFVGQSRTVDVHIQTLRQKLSHVVEGIDEKIETVHGIGYRIKQ